MKTSEELADMSKDITEYAAGKYPMELYELGALFVSIGTFQIASAIPELWPQLKSAAITAHQLLNQEVNKQKAEALNKTTHETL